MASVPTIRIGYVPGMSLTELCDKTFCDLHLYAACDMFFLCSEETDPQLQHDIRTLLDPSPSGLTLFGRLFPPIQDRPDPIPVWHRPHDHVAARQ